MQPPSYNNSSQVNGTLILVLGVVSLLGVPILGPVAWAMGSKGLKLINSGAGDPIQRQNAMIGQICGVIGTVILVLAVTAGIVYLAIGMQAVKVMQDLSSEEPTTTVTRHAANSAHKPDTAPKAAIKAKKNSETTAGNQPHETDED